MLLPPGHQGGDGLEIGRGRGTTRPPGFRRAWVAFFLMGLVNNLPYVGHHGNRDRRT